MKTFLLSFTLFVSITLLSAFFIEGKANAALFCATLGNLGSGTGTPYCEYYPNISTCQTIEGVTCTGPYPSVASCVASCTY